MNKVVAEDLNDTLPTLYPVRHRRWQPATVIPQVEAPPETEPFFHNKIALKLIYTRNLHDNLDLTRRTAPSWPANTNSIPQVTDILQPVNMDWHFPHLLPLSTEYSKDVQLKTIRDVPHQKVINKIGPV